MSSTVDLQASTPLASNTLLLDTAERFNDEMLTRDRCCSKKKKWSKGKVKDKANNAVVLDKPTLYVRSHSELIGLTARHFFLCSTNRPLFPCHWHHHTLISRHLVLHP